ncbi:hypothetical protein HOF92_10380 [bacterium]|jgi:S1-C subfamily serine protease|nr:hypothetical protein [bacterium]
MYPFLLVIVMATTLNAAVIDGTKGPQKVKKAATVKRLIPEGKRLQVESKKPRGILRRGSVVFVPSKVIKEETTKIQKLTSSFKFRPFRNMRGRISGYQIHSLVQGGFASLLGFEEKDVILSVNRREIHSASDIYKNFRRLKKSSKMSTEIEFLRAGKKRVMKFIRRERKEND